MSHTFIENQLAKKCLGLSRQHCSQLLTIKNIDSIAFGHWLAIPSQQLLLVFRHQRCIAIDYYDTCV